MLLRFFRSEPAAAIVLLLAAGMALIVANSPAGDSYHHLLETKVAGLTVHHWINDALMALFFLMVGLEIKREMIYGALARWRDRLLPGMAAIGGMAVPALIFVAFNRGDRALLAGWAIPTATDIAFTLGVLAILGKRVPAAIRIIVVGVAIIDDLLAILVIALFYSQGVELAWLIASFAISAALFVLNKRSVMRLAPYLVLGVILWIAVYNSGLHATLAGVILAMAIPARNTSEAMTAPLNVLEHNIVYVVNFAIVPIFGFANAGVALSGLGRDAFIGTLPLGIAAGLFIGKQVGIFGTIWLLVRIGIARMPPRVTWSQLHAMSILCGIGFTMSLFIGGLAFATTPEHMDATKIGVILGSVLSAVIGTWLMRRATDAPDPDEEAAA